MLLSIPFRVPMTLKSERQSIHDLSDCIPSILHTPKEWPTGALVHLASHHSTCRHLHPNVPYIPTSHLSNHQHPHISLSHPNNCLHSKEREMGRFVHPTLALSIRLHLHPNVASQRLPLTRPVTSQRPLAQRTAYGPSHPFNITT